MRSKFNATNEKAIVPLIQPISHEHYKCSFIHILDIKFAINKQQRLILKENA